MHSPAEAESLRLRRVSKGWEAVLMLGTVLSIFLCVNQLFNLRLLGGVLLDNQYMYALMATLLPLCFLLFPAGPRSPMNRIPAHDIALFAVTLAVSIYFVLIGRAAVERGWEYGQSNGVPDHAVWASYLLWALATEALRRSGGWGLMWSVTICAFYPVFADKVPGPIAGLAVSLPDAAAYHIISTESMMGVGLKAFAELVIGFLIFGVALQYTGAGPFFINFAFALLGTARGGAAKVAIFASGLLGSMSGSVVSNVLTAGTMTIPAMKRTGFPASTAASIEACASTGAVLMPPVMGTTAFVMASFLNVPYAQVALAAALPSILYYFGLFMQIDAYAARHGMVGLKREELPTLGQVFRDGWYYLFVVALLVWMLLWLKRESHAPFFATVLLLILNQILAKERWGWKELRRFILACGELFAELVAILAGVGLLIGAFSVTGLTGTLTNDLLFLAGDNVMVLLVMGAITSFILGLGMTTTACYIFLAVLLAPALVKAGLSPMAIHLFLLYWGMLSFITPPVALASFTAASIAQAPPMKTSWESMWAGSIIYFIPFFFVLNPALILDGPIGEIAQLTTGCVVGIIVICCGLQGYVYGIGSTKGFGRLEWPIRLALIAGGILFATPGGGAMPWSATEMDAAALIVTLPTLALAWLLGRRGKSA